MKTGGLKKVALQRLPLVALLTVCFIIFWKFFGADHVLLTTDAAISGSSQTSQQVLRTVVPHWFTGRLLGSARGTATQVASVLKAGVNGVLWNNVVYGVACLLASISFMSVNRRRLLPWATTCGALTACWLGSNFTLLYAGHTFKPYVVLFFVCSLIAAARSARGSIPVALVWGSCVGLMFAQQPDVAMFFALFAGSYLIFRLWEKQGFKPLNWLKVLVPAAVVAFLFAAGPLLSGYKQQVKGTVQMETKTPQEKWDYVTQWSFPPEELIAFVAPGYTGWRSGEPEGPYWGRMGRSAGWEQTRQGFQNFKLENTYLGIIPIAFALFALFSCRQSKHRAETLFWGVATALALLLAFGKFSPLYALFYKLPVVNNIRNPNKFLQVFQVCLAILTAYGFDALFKRGGQRTEDRGQKTEDGAHPPSPGSGATGRAEVRAFFWGLTGVLGILGIWALSLTLDRNGDVGRFVAQGWAQDAARVIVQNKITALWHASFMAAVLSAVFAIFSFPSLGKLLRYKNWVAIGLVLIVAADAVKLSKHYVKEMPRSYIEANVLTDFLKKDLGHQRVALLSQQGIFGLWTTYLLPYNKIPTFNYSDMPRMAIDYKAFLSAGQSDPLNMWRFSAVKYLLATASVEKQLLAANCRKVFASNLFKKPDGGYEVAPDMNGQFAVFELLDTLPRYALFAGSKKGSDEMALNQMADFGAIVLPLDSSLPELDGFGQTGQVAVLAYRPGKVELRVKADVPTILRCAEKYDVDWEASVDGEPAEVGRVDYLCQGVAISAGEHLVELRYAPSKLFFYMQCAGYLIFFGALAGTLFRRKGEHGSD